MPFSNLPSHVGIIMDGNGRWAARRGLPRAAGHAAGMERMVSLTRRMREIGIEYVTLFALSTENMARPKEELEELFALLLRYLEERREEIRETSTRIRFIGNLDPLPGDVREAARRAEKESEEGTFNLTFAVNYGGRDEIVRAAAKAAEGGAVDEKSFSENLYTASLPDPDLVIRTGGERRLSNFLLYQSAYSELYFTKTLFPDFSERKLDKALRDFAKRDRRYGKVGEA